MNISTVGNKIAHYREHQHFYQPAILNKSQALQLRSFIPSRSIPSDRIQSENAAKFLIKRGIKVWLSHIPEN